jgi:tRNA A-37 threonylcarbamoyl transferase component Bud32
MTLLDALLLGFVAGALWLGVRRALMRSYLRVNPRYRRLLKRHGLISPRALLRLPAVIVSGHPDRNVSRVTLGAAEDAVHAYLKREHRVRWKQRFANLWAGYGLVSVSHREALALRRLRRAGIGCPEWIAVGADGQGRAFLVVEEMAGCQDLRRFLADPNLSARDRFRFARHLGNSLAQVHEAGFAHPDLYAKHVLVDPRELTISFLDWQRTPRAHRVSLREGWHDLAALDATLADDLANPRERRQCLRSYLAARSYAAGMKARDRALLLQALRAIRAHRDMLLRRRHIREARHIPAAKQELIWLDGEALCVTPEYHRQHDGALPPTSSLSRNERACATVALPHGGQGFFIRRRRDRFVAWLAAWFGGRPVSTPEVRQAGLLFRLQRYGVSTARLLAFGQRQVSPWRIESFLLTEPPSGSRSLTEWLARSAKELPRADAGRQRRCLLREIGQALQRMHAAGCHLHYPLANCEESVSLFTVHEAEEASSPKPHVTLARVDRLRLCRRLNQDRVVSDLADLRRQQPTASLSRTDELRVILSYLGCKRLTAEAKRFVRRVEGLRHREACA